MQRSLTVTLALTVAILSAPLTHAQRPQDGQSPREAVNNSFDRKSPGVGEVIPALKGYDADGNVVELGELKGDYTVLVFGCLT